MVVFTCNHCGESLQKPKVDKHYGTVCRRQKNLTCVDCMKDFRAEEYVLHTKCVTEEQRYSAKGSIAVGLLKKGEAKQESWMEMIKSIIEKETGLPGSVKNLLNTISVYNNVPRKKPKFINFIKSSSGGRINLKDVEAVWDVIEKYKAQPRVENKDKVDEKTSTNGDFLIKEKNGVKPEENNDKVAKKRKNPNNDEDINEDNVTTKKIKKLSKNSSNLQEYKNDDGKTIQGNTEDDDLTEVFNFKVKILELLNSKSDKTMSRQKLQKKILNSHKKSIQEDEEQNSAKVIKKLNKKLKKMNDEIELSEDTVRLIVN